MAHFIECSLPSRPYLSSTITNHAVNLGLCTSLMKDRERWYPDNDGIPSIVFKGCDVRWVFNNDKQRDEEYSRIVAASQGQDGGKHG